VGIDYASAMWGGEADPPCLIESFVSAARRSPGAVALIDGDLSLSYKQLLAWAGHVANDLHRHGSRPGDRVGIACPRGAEAVVAMVAAALSGRAYVPLDLEYPRLRLEHMLRDSGVGVVLFAGDTIDLATDAVAVPVRRSAATAPADAGPETWLVGHDPDRPVYVIYTSGSTGWPKAVVLAHSCLDNVARWQADCSPAPDLRTAQFAPLNFDVSFQEVFGTLCAGGTLVVLPERLRRDPGQMLAWLVEHRIQRLFLPYVALQMMAVAAEFGAPVEDLALVEINVAGEQLVCTNDIREFFTRLPSCRLVNHYGQSESAMVTYHVLDAEPARWPTLAPIGVPLPGCELLVDRDDPAEDAGELLVAGLPLAVGYLNQPELNARRYIDIDMTAHGHVRAFRTGDLVRIDGGQVRLLTRTDDDVKLRGIRINLAEVEAQLMAQPEIAAATVVVTEGGDRPRTLRAVVVPKDRAEPPDEEEVLGRLRQTQPEVSVPLSVTTVDSLPRTPSGKLDRHAVARLVERELEP
jgi:D-alanine--poly(phosphoribitol) ligase subunit 1